MIALLISTIVTLFLFIVFGSFLEEVCGFRAFVIDKILLGMVISNALTTLISLFFPVNTYTLLLFIVFSLLLLYFLKIPFLDVYKSLEKNRKALLISLPFILVAFLIATSGPQNYDTGLYHLQSIKWIEEYAAVPGLANLHGRFGFNPNVFTLFALSSFSVVFKQEIFSLNFILFSVLTLYFIRTLQKIYTHDGINNLFIFNLVLFLFMMDDLSGHLTSPTPDFMLQVIPVYVFSRLIPCGSNEGELRFSVIFPLIILCVFTVTVKLPAFPLLILVIFLLWRFRPDKREWLGIITLSSLIIIPWLIRNIILTGWLIYPFYQLDLFTFDWKVPAGDLISVSNGIKAWARSPESHSIAVAGMTLSEWFPEWWHSQSIPVKILLSAAFFSPLFIFIGIISGKIKTGFNEKVIILVSIPSVLFCLLLAPDLRFGKPFILLAAFSPLIVFGFRLRNKLIPYLSPFVILLMIATLMLNYAAAHYVGRDIRRIFLENSERIMLPENIEIPEEVKFNPINLNGYQIFVPSEGDRCFNHNLPCTPSLDSTVSIRNTTLQSGFRHNRGDVTPHHF